MEVQKIEIEKIATSVYRADDGIWYARNTTPISFPDDGNFTLHILQQNSYWFTHRNTIIAEVLGSQHVVFPFFDIGGGTGFVSKYIQEKSGSCVLVEPQADGYLQAKKMGVHHVIAATTADAGFNDNVMPSAGMFDVVEHIENDLAFMKMIHAHVQPGGKVCITVPALPMLWSDEDVDAGHYRRYTKQSLSKLLQDAGFEVSYISYFFSFLTLPLLLFRSLPSKFGIKRKSNDLQKLQKEHNAPQGLVGAVLKYFMRRELHKIKQGKTMSHGTSLIVCAQKK